MLSGRVGQGVGSLLVTAGVMLALLAGAVPNVALAQGGAAKDPLKLFEPMMPVFSNERCSNCHGGVNPINGDNHDGGPIDDVPLDADGDMKRGNDANQQCLECHDEGVSTNADGERTGPWRLAPKVMFFAGMDTLAMCKQIRDHNGLDTGDQLAFDAFIRHLSNDDLIGMAFEGKRGITPSSPFGPVEAAPPPIDRPSFIQLAQRWLSEGKAHCGTWTGTVTETISQSLSTPLVNQKIDTTISIEVKDGDAHAKVHTTGTETQKGQACYSRTDTFSVDQDADVNLIVQLNRDLPAGFQNIPVPAPPANVPAPPGGFPALPPGVPGQDPDGYAIIFNGVQVSGTDHWDQVNVPACNKTSGTDPYPLILAGISVNKTQNKNEPDHLHDKDVQTQGQNSVTIEWDLTRP